MDVEKIMSKIVKKTLSEQIYESLKEEIISKKISFGNRLVNKDLQEKFEVSSTPIRDAINRLYLDGLVEEVTKTGAKIVSFNLEFATEINEFICILCTSAVELSFQRCNDIKEVVKTLEKIAKKQQKSRNDEEYFYYDYEFHKTFFDYSKNLFLKENYKRYNVLRFLLSKYAYEKNSDKEMALNQHFGIIEAYKQGNLNLAKERMVEHYNFGIVRLNEALSENF